MGLNFYAFHIGDYASATRHLSWTEDAAYRRLLDAYYVRESLLPSEMRAVFRLVLATSDEQREAVEIVLREFFTETTEGWRHGRCDTEIAKATEKKAKAAESAKRRWGYANASSMPSERIKSGIERTENWAERNATYTNGRNAPNPNPNPNQKKKKKREATATPIPDDFEFTEAHRQLAKDARVSIDTAFEHFRDHAKANGRLQVDWSAAFRTWLRNEKKFSGRGDPLPIDYDDLIAKAKAREEANAH